MLVDKFLHQRFPPNFSRQILKNSTGFFFGIKILLPKILGAVFFLFLMCLWILGKTTNFFLCEICPCEVCKPPPGENFFCVFTPSQETLLRALGVIGSIAGGAFCVWRLVLAGGTDDDNTVRFKVLYTYLAYAPCRMPSWGTEI